MTEQEQILFSVNKKGLTLEQAWRLTGGILGKPVCLLAIGKPSVPVDDIEYVVEMSPKQLTNALADILKLFNKEVQVLCHDGKIGQFIVLFEYDSDTSRFVYYDPSDTSLLRKEYNGAGIDAKREIKGWSVTASELERVIFASFIFQNYWTEYTGEKYYITYDEFKHSDFWSFFHINEISSSLQSDNNNLIALKTGGFQSEIDMMVTLNQKKRLVIGRLNVKRSWITDPFWSLNPFALDIVRSFIGTLITRQDQGKILDLIEMFHKIGDVNYTKKLISESASDEILIKALHTYLGVSPSFEIPLSFSKITMYNITHNEAEWLQIVINSDAL